MSFFPASVVKVNYLEYLWSLTKCYLNTIINGLQVQGISFFCSLLIFFCFPWVIDSSKICVDISREQKDLSEYYFLVKYAAFIQISFAWAFNYSNWLLSCRYKWLFPPVHLPVCPPVCLWSLVYREVWRVVSGMRIFMNIV